MARRKVNRMMRVIKGPPVDYRLCNQTVTLYHAEMGDPFTCRRIVFRGAHFDAKKTEAVDKTGSREANGFLLVLPSGWAGRPVWAAAAEEGTPAFSLAAGDKVFLGEGPEISDRAAWAKFVPASVPGLVVVKDVDVKYWSGQVCHIEAGG